MSEGLNSHIGLTYTAAHLTGFSMGIPGLARRLEPYATQYSPEELEGYIAVIDGPALAYFGHKLAIAASPNSANLPTYTEIANESIGWLNALEQHNIKV